MKSVLYDYSFLGRHSPDGIYAYYVDDENTIKAENRMDMPDDFYYVEDLENYDYLLVSEDQVGLGEIVLANEEILKSDDEYIEVEYSDDDDEDYDGEDLSYSDVSELGMLVYRR